VTAPLTYTVEEAARLLGVSRGVAYTAAKSGELPTIRLCRRLLVPRSQLDAMLGITEDKRSEATPSACETSTIARQEGDHPPGAG
jgi:excisionase family DNA binding protein